MVAQPQPQSCKCTRGDFGAGVVSTIPAIFTVPSSTLDAREDQRLSIQRSAPLSHEESDHRRPTVPPSCHPALQCGFGYIFLHSEQGRCIYGSGGIFNHRGVIRLLHNLATDRPLFAIQDPDIHIHMALNRANSAGCPLRPSMGDVIPLPQNRSSSVSVSPRSSKPARNGIAAASYERSN